MSDRCELTELYPDQCAHCNGVDKDYARPYTGTSEPEWSMGAWDE